MKILLFGKDGQVGWELQRSLAPLGEIIALGSGSSHLCGNFNDPQGLVATIQQCKPDVIVNAAAYTAVDKAEKETDCARLINATAPGILAREAKALGAWLIHYSTDYVFDGSGHHSWAEEDATGPLNCYGLTKLEGENAVQQSGCKYLIFRTSWVYAARGNNFAKTILRLAKERDSLQVINDQFGAPTSADLLADVTAHALRSAQHQPHVSGLYHVAAAGATTWYDYANFVLNTAREKGVQLQTKAEAVIPVPTSAFPTPAIRPSNSRLNTNKVQNTFDLVLPHWQTGVARMLTEILEK